MQIELEQFLAETINQDKPMSYLYELRDGNGNIQVSQSAKRIQIQLIELTNRLSIHNYDTKYGGAFLMHALPLESIVSIEKIEDKQSITYSVSVGDHSSLTLCKIFSR